MKSSAPDQPTALPVSRAGSWSVWTALISAVSLLILPALGCGCHFHISSLIYSLLPIGWGFYLLVRFETWGERITAYVATLLSLAWMYLEWDSNLMYIFTMWD